MKSAESMRAMNSSVRKLNDYVGALLLAATVALTTNAIVSYANQGKTDVRIENLEQFVSQQKRINESVAVLAQHVAVLQDRQSR